MKAKERPTPSSDTRRPVRTALKAHLRHSVAAPDAGLSTSLLSPTVQAARRS